MLIFNKDFQLEYPLGTRWPYQMSHMSSLLATEVPFAAQCYKSQNLIGSCCASCVYYVQRLSSEPSLQYVYTGALFTLELWYEYLEIAL